MNKKQFTAILTNDLNRNLRDIEDFKKLVEVLTPFDGKVFNGHVFKKLPANYVPDIKVITLQYLSNKETGNRFLVCRNWIINVANLERENTWATVGANERVNKINAIMNNPARFEQVYKAYSTIQKLASKMVETIKQAETDDIENFNIPSHWELLKACGIDSDIWSNAKYNGTLRKEK